MEPRLQFVRTSDRVTVAYCEAGQGPALISISLPSSHAQREWQTPAWRSMFEASAQFFRFVRYDPRGTGSSDRDVRDFSLDALVRDVEALIDRLGVATVQLMGIAMGGTVALAYAARHPEQVSHLVVFDGFDRGGEVASPKLAALTELARTDWAFAVHGLTRAFTGWEEDESARASAEIFRDAIHPEQLLALIEHVADWDVTEELPRIAATTLVVQHAQNPAVGPHVARRLASSIPECEVVLLDGPMRAFLGPETGALIGQFLAGIPVSLPQSPPPRPVQHTTAIILFADIAGSTRLTEQLGDREFHERARLLDGSLRAIVRARRGEAIDGKLLGDGMLAVFAAASDALSAALECAAAGDVEGLPLHLGIHAGDVIRDAGNVHGGAVNIAARISAKAGPGEVLVSDVVRSLARTSTVVVFEDRGQRRMKGVADALRVYRATSPTT